MNKEEAKVMIMIVVKNIISIVCFTILSIIFKMWWLILLSLLFLNNISYKSKDKTKPILEDKRGVVRY